MKARWTPNSTRALLIALIIVGSCFTGATALLFYQGALRDNAIEALASANKSNEDTVDVLCEKKPNNSACRQAAKIPATADIIKSLPGPVGAQGIQGISGRDGEDGEDGEDGRNGRNGKDGKNGKDGLNGRDSTDGVDGTDGEDGLNGSPGPAGPAGPTGPTGVVQVQTVGCDGPIFGLSASYNADTKTITITCS